MITVEYQDIIKHIDLSNDINNGNLQKYLLNLLNLTIFDIKCIIFEYQNESLINGYNEVSFFSKFTTFPPNISTNHTLPMNHHCGRISSEF